jgi:L,D-transpeptidase catalytic domain
MSRQLALSAAALAAAFVVSGPVAGVALADGSATSASPAAAAAGSTVPMPAAATAAPATATVTSPETTSTATTTTPRTTTPTPKPPVKAAVTLSLPGAFVVHRQVVTVPGRRGYVSGVVRPYVPGQWVSVDTFLGRRLIKSDRLRVKPARNLRFGRFTEKLSSPRAGLVVIKVTHQRTAEMGGFYGHRAIAALSANAHFGSRGPFVALMQQRLAALHVYVPQSGVYDQQMGLALDAYHRLLGWGVSQSLDGRTISALLNGLGAFKVRYPHDGTHVEGNLGKQLLALIYGSKVYRIYPISSGKPSTPTVLGHFHVYQRTPGYLPDGMYFSSFFYGGYAIHGYNPAPDYPASHGCMRLPIIDAISVYDWLTYGDVVDVYL